MGKKIASSKPLEPGRVLSWGDSQKTEVAWEEGPREEPEGSEGHRGAGVRVGLCKPCCKPDSTWGGTESHWSYRQRHDMISTSKG